MDERKLERFPLTEDWFTLCSQKFKALSSSEKSSVILSLIDMCDTTARFNLLNSCNKALHCDILAFMPQIALDKILDMLPVSDVLNACKVSRHWNKSISQSTFVWKKKWLEMGIGNNRDQIKLHKRDWKSDCVIAQEICDKIAGGRAFDYDLDLFDDDFGYISAMDFCNGKLVLCHSNGEGGTVYSHEKSEWTNLCSFPAAKHGYPSVVRFLQSNLMIVGACNGKITIWRFSDIKPGNVNYEVALLHSCHGHTSIVLSVDGSDEIGVAVSGSRDSRVKVWSLSTGFCVKTFDYPSPVLQVSFFCGENSLLKGYNFLLIHSSEKIFLQSWSGNAIWLKDESNELCIVTDANIMPGIHINNGTLYYCSVSIDGLQQTYFNCKQLNLREIVGSNDHVPLCCANKVISFQGIFRKLMQVGMVFALLIADDNIMAIDIRKGIVLFRKYVPYSAATSLTLPQITVGGDKWLDGFLYLKRYEMLLALAIYGRSFTALSWTTSIPEFPSKED